MAAKRKECWTGRGHSLPDVTCGAMHVTSRELKTGVTTVSVAYWSKSSSHQTLLIGAKSAFLDGKRP